MAGKGLQFVGNLARRGKVRSLRGFASFTPGAMGAPPSVQDLTLTVKGAVLGDAVKVGIPSTPTGGATPLHCLGFVSAADTVIIRWIQTVGAAQTPPAGVYTAIVDHDGPV